MKTRIFAALKNGEIMVVDEEDLLESGLSLGQFFKGFEVVIGVPEELFWVLNEKMLRMALKHKKGGPDDLLSS